MFWKKKQAEQTITLTDHVRIVVEKIAAARTDLLDEVQRERETAGRLLERNIGLQAKLDAAIGALGTIAEQETPTANATVKRMARIARDGIGTRNAVDLGRAVAPAQIVTQRDRGQSIARPVQQSEAPVSDFLTPTAMFAATAFESAPVAASEPASFSDGGSFGGAGADSSYSSSSCDSTSSSYDSGSYADSGSSSSCD